MIPFIKKIIVSVVKRQNQQPKDAKTDSSFDKSVKNLEVEVKHEIYEFFYLLLGVLSASFGLRGFLMPNGFIDGGITGISLMINELTNLSLPLLLVCFNLPFLILAYFSVGKSFAIKSVMGITFLAIAVALIPFPQITDDKILIAPLEDSFLA